MDGLNIFAYTHTHTHTRQDPEIILVRGLVKFVPALAYHFCLNLPASCNILATTYTIIIFPGPVQVSNFIYKVVLPGTVYK